jgi:hypothetical protein
MRVSTDEGLVMKAAGDPCSDYLDQRNFAFGRAAGANADDFDRPLKLRARHHRHRDQ